VVKMRGVEALQAVEGEFPIEEYRAFTDGITLGIKRGALLVAPLGDTSNGLQAEIEPEIEDELLGP
jgi:hypothetical protein